MVATSPGWGKWDSTLDKGRKPDKIGSMDITKEGTKTKGINGTATEKREYMVNGVTYKVDGKHVIHPQEGGRM